MTSRDAAMEIVPPRWKQLVAGLLKDWHDAGLIHYDDELSDMKAELDALRHIVEREARYP